MPPLGNKDFSPAPVAKQEDNLRKHNEAFNQLDNRLYKYSRSISNGNSHLGFLQTMVSLFKRQRRPLNSEDEREAQLQSEVLLERIESITRINLATSASRRLYRCQLPLGCFQPDPRSWEFLKPNEFSKHPAFVKRKDRQLPVDLQDINDFLL